MGHREAFAWQDFACLASFMHPHLWYKMHTAEIHRAEIISMKINRLRPTKPTNLNEISALLRQFGAARLVMPSTLTDPMLLSLARDLRTLDLPGKEREDSRNALSAPLLILIRLIFDEKHHNLEVDELGMSEDDLMDAFRIYQWAIEREIVARITGIGIGDEDKRLKQALQKFQKDRE